MSYRLAKQSKEKGIYLTIENKFWDKEKKSPGVNFTHHWDMYTTYKKNFPTQLSTSKKLLRK